MAVEASAGSGGNNNMQVVFRNCTPFTNCMSEISNTHIDNAKDIDVVMPMYKFTEYINNYSKKSGSLCQYYRDESVLTNVLADFPGNSASFKYKRKRTGSTRDDGTKTVKMMVPLNYLSNFWRTL